jgi:hypothetical protein
LVAAARPAHAAALHLTQAVAGVLHPVEGQLRVRGRHAVDEHSAGVEVVDEVSLLRGIGRPGVRAEPVRGRVGEVDGLGVGGSRVDRCRPKVDALDREIIR